MSEQGEREAGHGAIGRGGAGSGGRAHGERADGAPSDEDGVDLLTTGMTDEKSAYARRLTTAMRLLAADASGGATPSAAVHPASAVIELSARRTRRALSALDAIARHLLRAALPDGSLLQVERPEHDLGYTDAWRRLLRTLDPDERERLGLRIPTPGGAPADALEGVLRAMDALAADAPRSLAALRLERLRRLAEALGTAERDLGRVLEEFAQRLHCAPAAEAAATRTLRRGALLDAVALGLDARRVRDLGALLERVDDRPRDVASCRSAGEGLWLLAAWVCGWEDGARFPRIADDRAHELGLRTAAWREVEALVDGGPGGAAFALARPRSAHAAAQLDRRAVGARAVVVCRIDPMTGRVAVAASDCAPGVRDAVARWSSRRRDALRERGAPEHEVARRACALGWSAASGDDGVLRVLSDACLGGARSGPVALHVLPLLDGSGEVAGFVWIECEHALPPGPDARAALTASGAELIAGAEPVRGPRERGANASAAAAPAASDARLENLWRHAAQELQIKLAERRWVALQPRSDVDAECEAAGAVVVASGGEGELGALDPTGGRLVERAFRTGGTVRREADGVFADAQAGVAIPVRFGRRVVAVVCIESSRRGDVRDADVERWDAVLGAFAPDVAVATADARNRRSGHGGIALEPREPGAALSVSRLIAVVEARSHLCVLGDPGAGRAAIARLVAHASRLGGCRGRVRALSGGAIDAAALDDALDGARDDVLVLRDAGAVGAETVERVRARALGGASGAPRVVMTGAGSRAPALARALGAACIRVAPLRARRTEIVPIARAILARHAGPGDGAAALDESAEAMLWRQPWPGHCDDLASVLSTAALHADGERPIDAAGIAAALVDSGLEPLQRLPSRDPDPRDVASALLCTRTATGRINKSRASAHLGWDPGTLAARLEDLGIGALADAQALLERDVRLR